MGMYDDLLAYAQPGECLGKFRKTDLLIIKELKSFYLDLPKEYLFFLEEIGSGEIGDSVYTIYNGLLSPEEIYDEVTAAELGNILIFGDDMQGYCSGFDTANEWSIVEIDSTDMSYRKIFERFSDFIRDKLKNI